MVLKSGSYSIVVTLVDEFGGRKNEKMVFNIEVPEPIVDHVFKIVDLDLYKPPKI